MKNHDCEMADIVRLYDAILGIGLHCCLKHGCLQKSDFLISVPDS